MTGFLVLILVSFTLGGLLTHAVTERWGAIPGLLFAVVWACVGTALVCA